MPIMRIPHMMVTEIDEWLDAKVGPQYEGHDLAQDWARISKVQEELGEAVAAFIGTTGQNPRKGCTHDLDDVLEELADTAWTAIFAMQHFTKNSAQTEDILEAKMRVIYSRTVPKMP